MALVACRECGKEMSSTAKACPQCGALPRRGMSWIAKVLLFLVSLPAALMLLGLLASKTDGSAVVTTYGELAAQKAERCIRNKGEGEWRGSMGITLAEFCKAAANLEVLRMVCKEDPARC